MYLDFGSSNQDAFNDLAEELVKETLARDFKIPYKIKEGHTLSLDNIKVTRPDSSSKTYLKKKTLNENIVMRVYADVIELDDNDRKVDVIDKKVFLGVIPCRTPAGTYLLGNDYNVISQERNNPSVYTIMADNGRVSSAFQLEKGRAFKLTFTDSGLLRMKVGQKSMQAMPLLSIMNVTGIKDILGPRLAEKNNSIDWQKFFNSFNNLFFYDDRDFSVLSDQDKKDKIYEYMTTKTKLDPETTESLVGVNTDHVNRELLEAVLRKLVRVYKKEDAGDDRWDLRNTKIMTPSHLFADRLTKQMPRLIYSVQNKITDKESARKKLTNIISKPIKDTVLKSDLSRHDPQYNMIGAVVTGKTISPVGEGAISSVDLVEDKGRQFHPTQTGVMDLTFTPQGNAVGISLRAAPGLVVDKKGVPYIKLKHIKSGRTKNYPLNKLGDIYILMPGEPRKGSVQVLHNYEEETVPFSKVTHTFARAVYADSMQYTPLTSGMQGPRGIMAATQLPQAVPLINREAPRVISTDPETGKGSDVTLGRDYLERLGLIAPVPGTVKSIKEDEIRLVSEGGQERVIKTENITPLQYNTGLRIFPNPGLKVGDKVKKGDPLFLTNMHDNTGRLAAGKHFKTAWMVDSEGYGIEDGIVISESAAKKDFVSEHFYKKVVELNPGEELDYKKFRVLFNHKYTPEQFAKIDPHTGIIRKGEKVNEGDLLSCRLTKRDAQEVDKVLGRISRSLSSDVMDTSDVWDKMNQGDVLKVKNSGRKTIVVIQTEEAATKGSKIAGRFGNKGVVAIVRPDKDMPVDKTTGERIDVILPAVSVPSRVNVAQTQEGALGETGKTYVRDPFDSTSNQTFTEKEMVKSGLPVSGKHTVYDPLTDTENEIGVGKSYLLKLFSPEKSISARGLSGAYDGNKQPVKGGKSGSKALGLMEFYGLLGHNSKDLLKEFGTVKSEKNLDYWRQFEMGMPNMPKSTPYTFGKFNAILTAAGAQISRSPNGFYMMPVTDKVTDELSKGRTISEMGTYRGTNMEEIKDGLFDMVKTGGKKGELWSAYKLADGIPHPLLSQVLRVILNVPKKEWEDFIAGHTGTELKNMLNDLSVSAVKKRLQSDIKDNKDVSNNTQALRFLDNVKNFKDTDLSDFIITKLPVVPPKFRPMIEMADGTKTVNDLNYLYMDVMSSNNLLKDSKDLPETQEEARKNLWESINALVGLKDPRTKSLQEKGVKGALTYITGKASPKEGFFLNKMMKRQMINTGRARIIPDPTANMDEVGIPEHLAWNTYEQHLRKELRHRGHSASEVTEMIVERKPAARQALEKVLRENYILVNRAPSLHKNSIIAGKPHMVDGPFISIPPAFESPLNADYDGDEVTIHAPVTAMGKKDAEKMMLRNNPFTGYSPWDLTTGVDSESVAGLYMKWDRDRTGFKKWWEANMPENIKPEKPMDKGAVKKVLREIGKKYKGERYAQTVSELNRIGIRWASEQGLTVGLEDIKPMKSVKGTIDKYKSKLKGVTDRIGRRKLLVAFQKEMLSLIDDLPDSNNLKIMVKSKAKSNPVQLNAIVGAPAVYLDTRTGEAKPVYGNISDGYSFSDHLKMNAKARDEMVKTKMSIAGPGDLYKQMAFNTRQGTVTMKDCGTQQGIVINPKSNSFKSDDLIGRLLAEGLGPYKRNTVISPDNLSDIIGFPKIVVRSPSTCEADKGICAMCYGVDDDGNLFEEGTPVNITAINSFSMQIAQKGLDAKHSVRSVSGDEERAGLFDNVKNLLTGSDSKLAAPIAVTEGVVLRVTQLDDKSYELFVDDKKYKIPYPLKPSVKKGDKVDVGMILATGANVNTKQVANTLGLGYARDLFTEALHGRVLAENGITPHQRNVELLARELYKYVKFLKPVAGFMPGDVVPVQEALPVIKDNSIERSVDSIKAGQRLGENIGGFLALDMVSGAMVSRLKEQGVKRVLILSDKDMVKPEAKGISTTPLMDQRNWLDTMGFRFLKKNLSQALASGATQEVDHRINPITSYVTNSWE